MCDADGVAEIRFQCADNKFEMYEPFWVDAACVLDLKLLGSFFFFPANKT